jgi:hypothetical protein
VQDLIFSLWRWRGFRSSGMLCCIIEQVVPNISNESSAFWMPQTTYLHIITSQKTWILMTNSCLPTHESMLYWTILTDCLFCEFWNIRHDKGTMLLQNISWHNITYQETWIFINTAVRTSNFTQVICRLVN